MSDDCGPVSSTSEGLPIASVAVKATSNALSVVCYVGVSTNMRAVCQLQSATIVQSVQWGLYVVEVPMVYR